MLFSILILAVAAMVAPYLERLAKNATGLILAMAPASVFLWLLARIDQTNVGSIAESWSWFDSLGVTLTFSIDGLGMLMALLITGIGASIVIYARGYLDGHPQVGRFQSYLMLFMGSMLGLVLADNLLLLFVFWELTSISSFLLIGFSHESPKSRKNALQALLVTGAGAGALLIGFIVMGLTAGSWNLSEIITNPELIHTSPYLTTMAVLVLMGALTKSAQFPFHFWLPNAMAAPTPVSAYLHSATMVKAGVFLIAKLTPLFGAVGTWSDLLVICGGITFLLGAFNGLIRSDLKQILAYTTLSVLGIIALLLGIGSDLALKAALVFLTAHALYKAALFMVVGNIDHATGTRDVRELSGLLKWMPLTATVAILAALSKAGIPPFIGFIGKEAVYGATLSIHSHSEIVTFVCVIGNALLLALALKIGVHPFLGSQPVTRLKHSVPASMWLGPLMLAVTGLLTGILAYPLSSDIIISAVSVAAGEKIDYYLKLWHGWNLPLLLSAITVTLGLIVYGYRRRLWEMLLPLAERKSLFESIYDSSLTGFVSFAKLTTRLLQSGYLRIYFIITIVFFCFVLGFELFTLGKIPAVFDFTGIRTLEVAIGVLVVASTITAATAQSRITALLSLGLIGFSVATIFLYYSAPDLAITQIIVETLTLVLFMLVILKLPRFKNYSSKRARWLDCLIACSAGTVMTALVLKAQAIMLEPPISKYFGDFSYLEAKGRNVVNVILVDFRAMDTLGEITVLAIAAIGVWVLVRQTRKNEKDSA